MTLMLSVSPSPMRETISEQLRNLTHGPIWLSAHVVRDPADPESVVAVRLHFSTQECGWCTRDDDMVFGVDGTLMHATFNQATGYCC